MISRSVIYEISLENIYIKLTKDIFQSFTCFVIETRTDVEIFMCIYICKEIDFYKAGLSLVLFTFDYCYQHDIC